MGPPMPVSKLSSVGRDLGKWGPVKFGFGEPAGEQGCGGKFRSCGGCIDADRIVLVLQFYSNGSGRVPVPNFSARSRAVPGQIHYKAIVTSVPRVPASSRLRQARRSSTSRLSASGDSRRFARASERLAAPCIALRASRWFATTGSRRVTPPTWLPRLPGSPVQVAARLAGRARNRQTSRTPQAYRCYCLVQPDHRRLSRPKFG